MQSSIVNLRLIKYHRHTLNASTHSLNKRIDEQLDLVGDALKDDQLPLWFQNFVGKVCLRALRRTLLIQQV